MKKRRRGAAGFTLVEILVALAISGIIAAAVLSMFKSQSDSYVVENQKVEAIQNVRGGMDLISRDIRNAGYLINKWVPPFTVGNIDVYGDGSFVLISDNDEGRENNDAVLISTVREDGPKIIKENNFKVTICLDPPFENFDMKLGESYIILDETKTNFGAYRIIEREPKDKKCKHDCPVSEACIRATFDKDPKRIGGANPKFVGGNLFKLVETVYYIESDLDGEPETEDPALIQIANPLDLGSEPAVVAYGINFFQIGFATEGQACDSESPHPSQGDIINVRTMCPEISAITRNPFPAGAGNPASPIARSLETQIQVRNMGL